jgi:hypothetical protein
MCAAAKILPVGRFTNSEATVRSRDFHFEDYVENNERDDATGLCDVDRGLETMHSNAGGPIISAGANRY